MPHKADCCFVCKERHDKHGSGLDSKGKPCKSFEFVPASSRNDRDILFAAPFQSKSSPKVYSVQAWRQGDYSCNCTGWRNHRKCEHMDQVRANPEKYKNKQAVVINSSTSGSVIGTVDALNAEMAAIEAAVRRGDSVEIAALQAKIDYHRSMFDAAGAGLTERLEQVQANIRRHVFGGAEERAAQVAPKATPITVKVANPDDPFGD